MAASVEQDEALVARIRASQQELNTKKTFAKACANLVEICEAIDDNASDCLVQAIAEATKRTYQVMMSRFSTPKFWQAGLDLFLAVEFHVPASAVPEITKWREAAMEEVDEDCRERARKERERMKEEEERKFNKGRWSDANTPATREELAAAAGLILIDGEDDRRPGMHRDARFELRVVTMTTEEKCVVCLEDLPINSKAKVMPCGHKFHFDCLDTWVKKSNTCPVCRYDDLPSEKRHFDADVRRIDQAGGYASGLFS